MFCFFFFRQRHSLLKLPPPFFLHGVLSQNFCEQNSHKLRARASKSHKMSNAANTKTKLKLQRMKTKHRQKKRTKVREREGTKSATKFLFPGKNYASPRLSHARTRATSEFEVSLRKCDQFVVIAAIVNALSTGALLPLPRAPTASLAAAAAWRCGRGSSMLWPTLWSIRACWPSKLTAKRQQPWAQKKKNTHRRTHTDTHTQAHTKREKNGKVNYDLWSHGNRKWQ